MSDLSAVEEFLPVDESTLRVSRHLDAIEGQAVEADRTRSVSRDVIAALKGTDVMRMAATSELGGTEESVQHVGRELEAVAARCPSLAWTLWNHLAVFHLFVGALGPEQATKLSDIVAAGEWVSFPAGAGSGVRGRLHGDTARLNGTARWGTGARYGDHCGVVFAVAGDDGEAMRPLDLRFTMVRNSSAGITIEPTWDGSGLRASATDDVRYDHVSVDLAGCVAWFGTNRAESLRTIPVVHHRYREDWVGLSDLWLGWMAVGIVRRCLIEITDEIETRRVIMGARMVGRQTVQMNIGRALALTASARAAVYEACAEVDRRIDAVQVPSATDYFRQQAIITMALEQLTEAVALLRRTLGGNGLREGADFERRVRDFQAMPLHINAHHDRITHQVGRLALGIDLDNF
jgi:alkylation response protein AidB-like acyl-CoA dehydrogenase